jgi:CheY-like chemotaxis protein
VAQILFIDDDPSTLSAGAASLRRAGHLVVTSSSPAEGLTRFTPDTIDLVITELRLQDSSGLDILRMIRRRSTSVPLIVLIANSLRATDLSAALRLGVSDFVVTPIHEEVLLRTVERSVRGAAETHRPKSPDDEPQAHAVGRWARALVPIVDCPTDLRTVGRWSRWIAASPGAVRNWCAIAGIGARRSLVFGRILRAVMLGEGGRRKPENLLDVVDRRTLSGLMRLAGLPGERFPRDIDEYLERQILVRDPDALSEVKRVLADRERNRQKRFTQVVCGLIGVVGLSSIS